MYFLWREVYKRKDKISHSVFWQSSGPRSHFPTPVSPLITSRISLCPDTNRREYSWWFWFVFWSQVAGTEGFYVLSVLVLLNIFLASLNYSESSELGFYNWWIPWKAVACHLLAHSSYRVWEQWHRHLNGDANMTEISHFLSALVFAWGWTSRG